MAHVKIHDLLSKNDDLEFLDIWSLENKLFTWLSYSKNIDLLT